MRHRQWLGLALVASLSLGCGGRGAIFLTIEAVGPSGTLRIPEEVDALGVKVTADAGGAVLLEKQFPLGAEQNFPLTLGLEPGGQTGDRVRIEVTASKAEQPVAFAGSLVAMNPREVTSVTLRLSP